jgi:hypothetical protein
LLRGRRRWRGQYIDSGIEFRDGAGGFDIGVSWGIDFELKAVSPAIPDGPRRPLLAALTVPTVIVLILGIEGLAMGVVQIIGAFKAREQARSFSVRSTSWSEFCCWAH